VTHGLNDLSDLELLQLAFELVRELAGSNIRSLELASQLTLTKEFADVRWAQAHAAIDRAAASEGDPGEIDRTMTIVSGAQQADEDRVQATSLWAIHRGEVHRLVEFAERLLALAGPTRNLAPQPFVPR
jgi:hypothetical protein